jgi:hypothetical protein
MDGFHMQIDCHSLLKFALRKRNAFSFANAYAKLSEFGVAIYQIICTSWQ